MKDNKTKGLVIAMAAAGMFAFTPLTVSASSDAEVHCYGVNKCKGHNDCKTADNACNGKGSCKGHGYVKVSKDACEKIGGKEGK